ncbi:STT3 domain-containing protein [Geotalea toluenoxydans]
MKKFNESNAQGRRIFSGTFTGTDIVFTFIVFLVALAARTLPWHHVFFSGKVYLFDPDCYIRLRKILIYIHSFPQTHVYDYFQGFPKGTGVISSPAMEYLIAVFSYPFHNLSGFSTQLGRAVALAPSLIGSVTAVVMYFFVKGWWGRAAALCSGLVLALHPKHVEATVLGRFDNEMIEPLLLMVTFWLYIVSCQNRKNLRYWSGLGVLSAVYLMAWRGALFPLSIIGVDLILQVFLHRSDVDRLRDLGKGAGLMYLTAAAILGLICITDMWGTGGMFSWNIVSWFHVALFVCAGVPFFLLYQCAGSNKLDRQKIIKYACVAVVFFGLMFVLFGTHIGEGLKVIGGGNAWIDSISQYQRLSHISKWLKSFGILSLLAPFALFLLPGTSFSGMKWKRFLVLWTLVMVVSTIGRNRYAEYLTLNVSILAGMIIYYCHSIGDIRRAVMRSSGAVAVLLCLQIPTFAYFSNLHRTGGVFKIKGDIEDTMLWLRDNTPSPGDPYRPSTKPAYGVMARWDYGGWVESIALRPSIATNYGTETYGMEEVARFLLAKDEDELHKVLERNRVRYIIVDKILGDLPMYAKLIGNNSQFFVERWNPQVKKTEYLPAPETFSLISSRLFFADGSLAEAAGIQFQPVEGVRLVYESASPASVGGFPWEIKRLKIFEKVEGARVNVRGVPGAVVNLSQPIETNQGRVFVYNNKKYFDRHGMATFKLLYPRKNTPRSTGALESPQITSNGRKQAIQVRDSDISTGCTLEATLAQ